MIKTIKVTIDGVAVDVRRLLEEAGINYDPSLENYLVHAIEVFSGCRVIELGAGVLKKDTLVSDILVRVGGQLGVIDPLVLITLIRLQNAGQADILPLEHPGICFSSDKTCLTFGCDGKSWDVFPGLIDKRDKMSAGDGVLYNIHLP